MIIDVHAHAGPWFFATDVGAAELNLTLMDRYGIDRQIVSASEAVTYDMVAGNRWMAEVLEAHPRLLGYVVINPNDLEAGARELEKYLPAGRFVGVKVHTTYPGQTLLSQAIQDTMALAAQAGLPVLVHTWDESVLGLVDVLERHPDLRVIAGHMGGPAWRTAVEAATRSDRLYLEPCCSITDRGRYRYALDRVPLEQMLFGTDSTLVDPAIALGVVADADLTDDEQDHVMWRNAARLFGIGTEVAA
ncbi:amidohydrolase family protein [Lentzea sp. NBC_00516]|uniref:amidohydrolase family protein n=1 Tax=Lentzea sp. NBC_00516 TaxID=2903582 RepID=UPI002E80BBEF|nr:amidohydrolase family protein [Lentzea sp. NBC_00516]WUD28913.1 amidohydrolase family protein [Lentzea sp. NBC_00516]